MSTCPTTESLLDRLYRDQTAAKFRSELLWVFAKAIDDADVAGCEMDPSAVESLLDKGEFVINADGKNVFFAPVESLGNLHAKLFPFLASNRFLVEILPPLPFDDEEFVVQISQIPLSKQLGLTD